MKFCKKLRAQNVTKLEFKERIGFNLFCPLCGGTSQAAASKSLYKLEPTTRLLSLQSKYGPCKDVARAASGVVSVLQDRFTHPEWSSPKLVEHADSSPFKSLCSPDGSGHVNSMLLQPFGFVARGPSYGTSSSSTHFAVWTCQVQHGLAAWTCRGGHCQLHSGYWS